MHSAEDSAAIAVRILQRRERERAVEAAERRLRRASNRGGLAQSRQENDRLEAALAESRNEVASLRGYVAALEARLNGIYADMAQPQVSLRPRGLVRRLVRAMLFALLGAGGILVLQMSTPLGARLTDSLRKSSVGGLAAQLSQAIRGRLTPPTSQEPAPAQASLPPAPLPVQEPQPPVAAPPTSPPAPAQVAPPAQTDTRSAAVVSPPSDKRRVAPNASTKVKASRQVQPRDIQEAPIPACSDNDPLCGISKRP
jgi:hypothetical protein